MTVLEQMGEKAKAASRVLANTGSRVKDAALTAIADALEQNCSVILRANEEDMASAKQNGVAPTMLDRLALSEERIRGMAAGVREVAALRDPVGSVLSGETRPNGLHIVKVSVPLGVIGLIYEGRPNVTSDATALCLKSGNAVILRGGKEAICSNRAISEIMREAISSAGLTPDCIQLIQDTSRASATELMQLTAYLDVLIPRGGKGLIRAVVENAKVPVIETGSGNCHVYVDKAADVAMAADIIFNAKTSRPSVCNAIETILVHEAIAERALPAIAERLREKHVQLRGCEKTRAILGDEVIPVTEEDYKTEFLDYILAVRVVPSLEAALQHIARYSSGHSDCIVTNDYSASERFLQVVDSAAVYVNASTRFTDGGEFGLGCEIGISTQKLHARGPMGLMQLTSTKYKIYGGGQIR